MSCPTREDVLAAVAEADEAQGYMSKADLTEKVYGIFEQAVAVNYKGRPSVAIHRDLAMSKAYPLVKPLHEIEADDEDAELQRLTYKELRSRVWELTRPLTGRIQALLSERNGHVLCRVGGMNGDRAYITKDEECFVRDVVRYRAADDDRREEKYAEFLGGVSARVPGIAQAIADAYDTSLKQRVAIGRAHLPLLLEEYRDGQDFQGIGPAEPDDE